MGCGASLKTLTAAESLLGKEARFVSGCGKGFYETVDGRFITIVDVNSIVDLQPGEQSFKGPDTLELWDGSKVILRIIVCLVRICTFKCFSVRGRPHTQHWIGTGHFLQKTMRAQIK